jgi:hypothetical protein
VEAFLALEDISVRFEEGVCHSEHMVCAANAFSAKSARSSMYRVSREIRNHTLKKLSLVFSALQ